MCAPAFTDPQVTVLIKGGGKVILDRCGDGSIIYVDRKLSRSPIWMKIPDDIGPGQIIELLDRMRDNLIADGWMEVW